MELNQLIKELSTVLLSGKRKLRIADAGSEVDLRGLAADKPAFGDVDVGTTYWSVDTGAVEVATDTNWVVI